MDTALQNGWQRLIDSAKPAPPRTDEETKAMIEASAKAVARTINETYIELPDGRFVPVMEWLYGPKP